MACAIMSGILTFGKQKSLNLTWWPSLSFVSSSNQCFICCETWDESWSPYWISPNVHRANAPTGSSLVFFPQQQLFFSDFHPAWRDYKMLHVILVWLAGIVVQGLPWGQMLCPTHVNFIQSHYLNFVLPCYISECSLFVLMVWEGAIRQWAKL